MRTTGRLKALLRSGGFSVHAYVGRMFRVGFVAQLCVIAAVFAILIVTASVLDETLIMKGRDVGLLQHSTIWSFILLQVAMPLSLCSSLRNLIRARSTIRKLIRSRKCIQEVVQPLVRFMSVEDVASRALATLFYCVGIFAFIWNTFQNQRPGIVLPYDFWDSSNHFWGFWMTRVYKLYLFGWLLPYLGLLYFGIVIVVLRMIRRARLAGIIELEPFHPDGAGGLGFVPPLITTPIIIALLLGSFSTAAALEVHQSADITPIIGALIVVGGMLLAYVAPAIYFRTDILALKKQSMDRIRQMQQSYYGAVMDSRGRDRETLHRANEAVDYFDKVNAKIQSIPDLPHFSRLIRFAGLALTPSALSIAFKLLDNIPSFIRALPRTP
jgi:hypothetical protein